MAIICLTGCMGSGKTTVGKILAKDLACPHIDLDDEILRISGMKNIPEIFSVYGEKGFRELEARTLSLVLDYPDQDMVLSLGGGTVGNDGAVELIKSKTRCFYLEADARTLAKRVASDNLRPMLSGYDAEQRLSELLQKRDPLYRSAAHHIIRSADIKAEAAARLIERTLTLESMTPQRFLEVCCEGADDAIEAYLGGADRVELCSELACGGVTPDKREIRRVREECPGLTINVLIRCRAGNFVYSEDEIHTMAVQAAESIANGADGVVLGALKQDGSIDIQGMSIMIDAVRTAFGGKKESITFHRAFDECRDIHDSLEDIISLGCQRLLTSGHMPSAPQGEKQIASLVKQADGRINIMAGCGVRVSNIASLQKNSSAHEYHSSSHSESGHTDRNIVKALKTITL